MHKGLDQATVEFDTDPNEIKQYVNGQHLGAMEASWRMFENEVHDHYPSVKALVVHLPGRHTVAYRDESSTDQVLENIENRETELMAFFRYNAAHPTEKYLFQDFPRFFTSSKTKWKRRVNPSGQIGRMHPLSPLQGEVYYLRCLLLMVPGPTSFEDLRTVNGVRHDTFENACYARGIINRDNEWELCFDKPATSRPDGNYAVS